jgi:hypothetical protein
MNNIFSDEYMTSFGFYWVKKMISKMNNIFSDEYMTLFGFYWVKNE